MVRVDHARNDHVVFGIDHAIGCLGQLGGRANGLDAVVSDKDRGIAKFIACIVQRCKGVSVVDQQGSHRESFCTKKLRVSWSSTTL